MNNSIYKQVKLTFPDLHLLWLFAESLSTKSIEINRVDISLICTCTEADVTKAVTHYGAKIEEVNQTYGKRHSQNI